MSTLYQTSARGPKSPTIATTTLIAVDDAAPPCTVGERVVAATWGVGLLLEGGTGAEVVVGTGAAVVPGAFVPGVAVVGVTVDGVGVAGVAVVGEIDAGAKDDGVDVVEGEAEDV